MQAKVGDRIVVQSNNVGTPQRTGEIIEARGPHGTPPYWVRWSDGHEGLYRPGPDAVIQPRRTRKR